MKMSYLAQAMATFANFGVIAGIVFLAFELRQNNVLMDAEARRARSSFVEEANFMIATDAEFASLLIKDATGESLDAVDRLRISRYYYAGLSNLDVGYYTLSTEERDTLVIRWRRLFEQSRVLRETWANQSGDFNAEFVDWLNERVFRAEE